MNEAYDAKTYYAAIRKPIASHIWEFMTGDFSPKEIANRIAETVTVYNETLRLSENLCDTAYNDAVQKIAMEEFWFSLERGEFYTNRTRLDSGNFARMPAKECAQTILVYNYLLLHQNEQAAVELNVDEGPHALSSILTAPFDMCIACDTLVAVGLLQNDMEEISAGGLQVLQLTSN